MPLEKVGILNPVHGSPERCVALALPEGEVRFELVPDLPLPDEVEVIDVEPELESRRVGLISGGTLANRRVVLFGTGSLGSKAAELLSQAGVGDFALIDEGQLDAANLSRHACGLLDLGRSKAVALADHLRARGSTATPIVRDILSLAEASLDGLLEAADLAVTTTDSPAVQFVVNEACVRTRIPGVFAGAYERACGGEVLLVAEGGPCLYCATGFRTGLGDSLQLKERRRAYESADENPLEAEPGLGADITYLASVAAAYALAALDPRGSRAPLLDPRKRFALVHGGSEPRGTYADLFTAPFDLVYAKVVREEPCPVCGWQNSE